MYGRCCGGDYVQGCLILNRSHKTVKIYQQSLPICLPRVALATTAGVEHTTELYRSSHRCYRQLYQVQYLARLNILPGVVSETLRRHHQGRHPTHLHRSVEVSTCCWRRPQHELGRATWEPGEEHSQPVNAGGPAPPPAIAFGDHTETNAQRRPALTSTQEKHRNLFRRYHQRRHPARPAWSEESSP